MTMQYKVKLKEGKGIDLSIIYNTNQVIEKLKIVIMFAN